MNSLYITTIWLVWVSEKCSSRILIRTCAFVRSVLYFFSIFAYFPNSFLPNLCFISYQVTPIDKKSYISISKDRRWQTPQILVLANAGAGMKLQCMSVTYKTPYWKMDTSFFGMIERRRNNFDVKPLAQHL